MNRRPIAPIALLAVAIPLLIAIAMLPALAAPCETVVSGQPVILKSADMDPDVFVWDSRGRVVEYSSGYWKNTSDVMSHTLLSKPGTRAVIVACDKSAVHSKFANDILDAVGIKIVSGPNRGRYGWVTSEDIHAPTKAATARTRSSQRVRHLYR